MTYEQLADWQTYWAQEPWGDIRDDMRAAANTLWIARLGDDSPDLTFPYFAGNDPNELAKRAKLLDEKIAEIKGNGRQ